MVNGFSNWPGRVLAGVLMLWAAGSAPDARAQTTDQPAAGESGPVKMREPGADGAKAKPGAAFTKKSPAATKSVPKATPVGDDAKEIPSPEKPPSMLPAGRQNFDLTPDQAERFKKYLPKTFAKLSNREPVHLVAVGDSIVDMYLYDDAEGDWLKGWPAAFGKELAAQFYYTGDLRIIKPNPKKLQKDRPFLGPEITLRCLGRGGKTMIHAMQTLTAYAFETPPDVVMVSFGINDANDKINLETYRLALQQVIETVRSREAELILLGPTLTVEDPPEMSLAETRPYTDTMRQAAADNRVFFVDLGDLHPLVSIGANVTEPAVIFDQVVKQYRRFFNHGGHVDFIHPRPEMHKLLGKRIFQELVDGHQAAPWTVSSATATRQSQDELVLACEVKNTSEKDLTLAMLPLVKGAWKPMDAVPQVTLKPGETKTQTVTYARQDSPGNPPDPSHEALLREPFLFSGGGMTRIEDVRAEIRPLALLWNLRTLFNQSGKFTLELQLLNTSAAMQDGTWSAEWMGQKQNGKFAIAAGEREPLAVAFDLPAAGATTPWRQLAPITMTLTTPGLTLRQERAIQIMRNFGLKQAMPLSPSTQPDRSPLLTGARQPGLTVKADADATALYLTYEITGINMQDAPKARGAFGYELSLDARSYGQRLGFGATDSIKLNGTAADGPCQADPPQPWAFGTGYAARFDPQYIGAKLSSSADGARRLTVSVPKSYLYLHEWALGNGNSQLGINTAMMFWQESREAGQAGGYPPELFFQLTMHGRHRDDAESLAVLELTEKPTNRWTVNPW